MLLYTNYSNIKHSDTKIRIFEVYTDIYLIQDQYSAAVHNGNIFVH